MKKPFEGNFQVTQRFGVKDSKYKLGYHAGTDYGLPNGTSVTSTESGKVIKVGEDQWNGKHVFIESNGFTHKYLHLSLISVDQGQNVSGGQMIGRSGSTGQSTGPHLHFQVEVNGQPVDPETFLNKTNIPVEQQGGSTEIPLNHTIQKNDTFWDLENRYNIPHGTLQQLNPDKNPKTLQIGDTIRIKAAQSTPRVPTGRTHNIVSGDTFWDLENTYGKPHGTLQQLNPSLDPRTLQIGTNIRID